MAALVQTLQLATPQQPFATIVQGIDEPFLCFAGRTKDQSRGDGGFGSTGPPQVRWTAVLTKDRPETLCTVSMVGATPSEIHLRGLLDTGADWLVDRPIWGNQWPLPQDKLVALHELVQEQLDQGHLEPSTSRWNTPVFCIKKKFGKWRLLQDLRKINAVMEGMGTLQAARALSGVCKQFPDARVYHYMDDILVAMPTQDELLRIQPQLLNGLHSHGLQVAPEKVQQQPPWKYLGIKILEWTIRHQEVQFVQSVKTLNDAQKLVYRIEPSIDVTVFISLPGGWRKALGASGLRLDSAAHVP
ncbi:hypothetical protein DUI87_35124 [Hirundo rustica rustica]|uniref:ribonuclease H n=1 Tax=Hirundo rustica rustica TaxID=333673 RepID=A0A3M0J1T6_HIRRU|nr:hypothetical protein DUI87_35124 [Hirundo rustica rustica]